MTTSILLKISPAFASASSLAPIPLWWLLEGFFVRGFLLATYGGRVLKVGATERLNESLKLFAKVSVPAFSEVGFYRVLQGAFAPKQTVRPL